MGRINRKKGKKMNRYHDKRKDGWVKEKDKKEKVNEEMINNGMKNKSEIIGRKIRSGNERKE